MPVILQLIRFILIGSLAAAVHLCVVILLVYFINWQPLQANVFGFLFGFQVSYWGHRYVTFYDSKVSHKIALPKLLLVQISCFVLNELFFYGLLTMHLPYILALFIVLATMPLFAFTLSKIWIFN